MKQKIMVVDDELNIRTLIKDCLENEYDIIEAKDGLEAIDLYKNNSDIRLIILDVMMPKMDGLEVLKVIRVSSSIPIIMLTAKSEDNDIVKGFDVGCTDYVTKPFSMVVLKSRIKSKLSHAYRAGNIYIDESKHKAYINSNEISLTLKEYELLQYLVSNQRVAISKEDLLQEIWKTDEDIGRTLDTHIKQLRSKILDSNVVIETVRSFGFLLDVMNYESLEN